MTPRRARAEYACGYKIRVAFDDGREGVIIDLQDELWGEVFEPLKDLDVFRCFRVDTELDTLVWPTGACQATLKTDPPATAKTDPEERA